MQLLKEFILLGAILSIGMLSIDQSHCQTNNDDNVINPPTTEKKQGILELYEEAFNKAFPINRGVGNTSHLFVLRFKPSTRPDQQIVIRYSFEHDVSIDYAIAKNDFWGFFYQKKSSVASELAKKMDVHTSHPIMNSDEFKSYYYRFWDDLVKEAQFLKKKKTFSDELLISLDGTTYELEYYGPYARFIIEINSGTELGNANLKTENPTPIVKWMNDIWEGVQKQSNKP